MYKVKFLVLYFFIIESYQDNFVMNENAVPGKYTQRGVSRELHFV